ncbi:MAG: hypothetical protein HYU34_06125 [Candidatus Omnitrophica bacterium]|nr:hypothetical protein [Candidatus Omnitrophota bacterium]
MKNQTTFPPPKPKGGFFWWLLWIVIAIGSFILSAAFWTWFLGNFFGEIEGTPQTILWAGAVFGSWLVTMIPIIRAKERYWNRMSRQDETHVTWWIGWIALTIAAFFASAGFWTWFLAREGKTIHETANARFWIFSVFGTWMIALVPLIVVMYQKVDRAYENARRRREENENQTPRSRTVYVDPAKRVLADPLVRVLKKIPPTIKKGPLAGHLVTVTLRDGRRFPNVFVAGGREILGIYGCVEFPFEAKDVLNLEPADLDRLPEFKEESWLRLDGRN